MQGPAPRLIAHLDQIMDTDGYVIPERANDEIALVVQSLGLG